MRHAELIAPLGIRGEFLASGPIVKGSCTIPCRAVIRDWGDEFVVHTQMFDERKDYSGIGFTDGYYVPKKDEDALKKCWEEFIRRQGRLFCWPEKSKEKTCLDL